MEVDSMSDEEEKSFQAGCDGHISKPIRIKELFKILNKYLSPKKK